MTEQSTRRSVLAGAATLVFAGCTSLVDDASDGSAATDDMATPDGTDTPDDTGTPDDSVSTETPGGTETLPENCPTTQNIDVEWPDELTAETVASFVEAYENAYYRETVVEYEPESRLDEYGLSATVTDEPRAVDGGFEVVLSGSGGVYRPTLHLEATTADAPENADVVALDAVENSTLRSVLTEAASASEATHHVDEPGERVEQFIDLVASLSATFDAPASPGESGTAYFDVDGTTVELTVQADQFHGDYWWTAHYYVDEHVVWRLGANGTQNGDGDPRDGELLECRHTE